VPDRLLVRLRRLWLELITGDREREEAELEARLRERRRVTRTNLAAVVSPKGGVGKTTCSYLIGDLPASRPKLRVLAIDTNPDFGTLGKLAPDAYRSEHQLTDVIAQMDHIRSAPELDPYMSTTRPGSISWPPRSGRRRWRR
jgi:Mrp family chromosome partitioning ATPase